MVLPVLFMGSCEKESEGLTRITYYPLLSVNGSSAVIGIGESFVDEGCTATLNGKDVSSEVQSSNNIDNTKYGAYKVNYIVYNEDGFSASASRDVFVTNGTNFANLYLADSKYGSRLACLSQSMIMVTALIPFRISLAFSMALADIRNKSAQHIISLPSL